MPGGRGARRGCGGGYGRTGQSTSYGDVKSAFGGAGEWDRSGCAKGAPRSANRQGEEQHRHTGRGSHTRRDKGEHSRQGGGAQGGGRGNQDRGPEWRRWESVRMGGSDNKGDGLASQPRRYRVPGQPLLNRHQVGGVSRSSDGLFAQQEREPMRGRPAVRGSRAPGPHATTSTSSTRQLLGTADAQMAHPATSSTAPTHQLLGSVNAETTPAGAPAAAADRTQRPDATCEGHQVGGVSRSSDGLFAQQEREPMRGRPAVRGSRAPGPHATTSTSSTRQLLGTADAQMAHPATSSTAPTHQLLGSVNAETTPAGAPAAAADRTQRPDATCEGTNG